NNQQETAPLFESKLNPGEEAGGIPLGVHLLGQGMKSLLGSYYENRPAADHFIGKLFQHLPLEDGLEEEIWLHLVKIPEMLFMIFPKLLLKAMATPMKVFQWIGQDADNIQQKDRRLDIKILPTPDKAHKYVIISDAHRDAPEDSVDEYFFDLSHFSKNRELFIKALKYYLKKGYTVIENGDCEELWLVPSVSKNKGVRARAERIIDPKGPNRRVYQLLAELHRRGRYYRTRGNHDDFWLQSPENFSLLRETWFRDGPEFRIWDAVMVPNVLTMYDQYGRLLKKVVEAKLTNQPIDADELVDLFPVGLSPQRYRQRRPIFIFHGHQTDFWNCDEHNFLGKILTNSIGIMADGITTFPYHLRGIDFAGRPILQFAEVLTEIPQVNNWLPQEPAQRLSRQIEQSSYAERRVRDNIFYSETLTAALSLALKYPEQKGLMPVQILASHTHWPQSRPHLPLGAITIPNMNKKIPLRLPTRYYNTGTCGWWEGILWGVEITDFGQPRLFYWERNLSEPHYMPWELHGEIPEQVIHFKEKVKKFLEKCFQLEAVFQKEMQNVTTWEEIDDFSEVRKIDLSALDSNLHSAALNTAQIWVLRHLQNRPQTSPHLEITVALNSLFTAEGNTQRWGLVSDLFSKPALMTRALKSFGIAGDWRMLDAHDDLYYHLGTVFFSAAHLLRNSLCNQLGFLLNMFITHEKELMIRFDESRQLLSIRLGAVTS
ncbi:MAG: hypothetical protein ONA90_01045, partial [candidate division KSB1 bacterium]|nr:hypothetical protein [candidate division KSB1 bacterium]